MPVWIRTTLLCLAVLIPGALLAAAVFVAVLQRDPHKLDAVLEFTLGRILDRELVIDEMVEADLGSDTYLLARGVRLALPAWLGEGEFVTAERVLLRINLPSLWREGPILIHQLELTDASLNLLAPAESPPSWIFRPRTERHREDEPAEFPVVIKQGLIERGTIAYSDPRKEIVTELATLSLREERGNPLLALDAAGAINGFPLAVEGDVGPAVAFLTGTAVQSRLTIRWGDLSISADGIIGDIRDLRGTELQLHAEAPSSRPLLDLLGMPEVSHGPLSAGAQVTDRPGGLNIETHAQLGEFALEFTGELGDPVLSLAGLDLEFRLEGPSLQEVGAAFEFAELPPIPYRISGQVQRDGSGLRLNNTRIIAGEGEITLDGQLPHFPRIDGWQAVASGRNIDLARFSPAKPADDAPRRLYDFDAQLASNDEGVELVDLSLTGGSSHLSLQGIVGESPDFFGTRLHLKLSGDDMSATAPLVGFRNLPPQQFALSGEVAMGADGWTLQQGKLESPGLDIGLEGNLDRLVETTRIDGQITLGTPDLAATLHAYGNEVEALRGFPLQFNARIKGRPDYIELEGGTLESGATRGTVSGTLGDLIKLKNLELEVGIDSPDLLELLHIDDAPAGVQLPLAISGQARTTADGLALDRFEGTLAGTAVGLQGLLRRTEDLAGSTVTLWMKGHNLDQALGKWTSREWPTEPFSLNVNGHLGQPKLELTDVQAILGGSTFTGNLEIDRNLDPLTSAGRLRVNGASSQRLLALLGFDPDVKDEPYTLQAGIRGDGERITMEAIDLQLGKSDLSGRISVRPGEVPFIDAELHSRRLMAAFLLPDLEELEEEAEAREAAGEVFDERELTSELTRSELAEKVIPDTPVELDLLARIEGDFRYDIGEIYLRDDATSSGLVDFTLRKGKLTTRDLQWDGDFSSGLAELTIDHSGATNTFDLYLDSRRMPLMWLMAGEPDTKRNSLYRARLSARGNTLREIAASLDGAVAYRSGGGRLDNKGLDLLMGDLFGAVVERVNPYAETEQYTQVKCNAGAFRMDDGVIIAVPGMVMRTDRIDMATAGTIDLNNERIDMTFNTRSRKGLGISAGKAITPYLKLGGTLANPRLTIDPRGAAISGSAAIATAGWSVLATGLWDRWVVTARNPCKVLVERAREEKNTEISALLARPSDITGRGSSRD